MNYFFHVGEPTPVHHKIRRDYPEVGDSALTIHEQDGAQTCFFLVRPEEENDMNFVAVVHVAEDKFATWATFQCPGVTGFQTSTLEGVTLWYAGPGCMDCPLHDTVPQVPVAAGVCAKYGLLVAESSGHREAPQHR